MSIVPDLLELFGDEVKLEAPLGFDRLGVPTGYGPITTWRAHIAGKHRLMRDLNTGQTRVSSLQVLIAGVPGATVHWRVTLPSRYTPARPKILSVEQFTDESGAHHEQLLF